MITLRPGPPEPGPGPDRVAIRLARLPRSHSPPPVRQDSAAECEVGGAASHPGGLPCRTTDTTTSFPNPGGTVTTPTPATSFADPAPAQRLERAAAALMAHGFTVGVLDDAAAGRARIKG